jgi:hypothetical protein
MRPITSKAAAAKTVFWAWWQEDEFADEESAAGKFRGITAFKFQPVSAQLVNTFLCFWRANYRPTGSGHNGHNYTDRHRMSTLLTQLDHPPATLRYRIDSIGPAIIR